MENYGKVFRKLRLDKGYSLVMVSKDIVSTSFLSKFERGESDISFNYLIKLLNRINVDINEFLFAANDTELSEIEGLFFRVKVLKKERDVDELLRLREAELQQWETYHIPSSLCNAVMIEMVIDQIKSLPVEQSRQIIIMDYLKEVNTWGMYELNLFRYTMISLTYEAMITLGESLLEKSRCFIQLPSVQKSLINVLLLITYTAWMHKDYPNMRNFLNKLANWSHSRDYHYEQIVLQYLEGLYEQEVSGTVELNTKIETAQLMMQQFGYQEFGELFTIG